MDVNGLAIQASGLSLRGLNKSVLSPSDKLAMLVTV
jgi:hypothetical protein